MHGFGSVQSMIDSLKNNKKLLRRKGRFEKERTFLNLDKSQYKSKNTKLATKKASPEILEKIRRSAKLRRKKYVLIYMLLILGGLIGLGFFILKVYQKDKAYVVKNLPNEQSKKEKAFMGLIKKGDGWFVESKWDAALFYYEKAQNVFPDDYSIDFRIAQTMSLKCENEYQKCHETKALLDTLYKKYPNKEIELNGIKKRMIYEY